MLHLVCYNLIYLHDLIQYKDKCVYVQDCVTYMFERLIQSIFRGNALRVNFETECDREGSRCNSCKEQRQWKWMSVNIWGQPSKTIMHKRDNEVEYQGWSVTDGQAARMKGDPYKMGETSSGWVSEARLRWFGHVLDMKLREGKVNDSGSSSCGNTKCILRHTTRMQKSYFPTAVRLLNKLRSVNLLLFLLLFWCQTYALLLMHLSIYKMWCLTVFLLICSETKVFSPTFYFC